MELLTKLADCFLSNLVEKSSEYALDERDKTTSQSLQNNVQLLCAKASDVDSEITRAERSGTKKRKRQVKEWLEQVQAIEDEFRTLINELQTEGFVRRFFGGGKATKLDARVHELVDQSKSFGELVLDNWNIKAEEFLTKGLVGREFDKNLKEIWNFLVNEKVSSIGIYGMGGAGKTTLAKHIYNLLIKKSQEHDGVYVVWITVSQEWTVRMLQDKMAKELGVELSAENDEDKRATRLNRALSVKKTLVLIFDDVWNAIDLMKLGDPLSVKECRLLITTRSEAVCHQLHCKKLIKVKKLEKDEAWGLFKETLGQATNLTPEIENIAESLVDECGGLPLCIVTLAASMRGESSIYVWRDALEKLREQEMEENVFKVLKHSFDWLGRCEGQNDGYSESQLCFLYCCLYPEDCQIYKDKLVRRFILEGFLSKRKSRKAMFDRGHAILDKLVNVCLLERCVVLDSERVKMHDLMRDMAIKITKGVHHCSVHGIPIEEELTKETERLLLSRSFTEIPFEMSLNFPKLVTLIVYLPDLKFLSCSFFLLMRSLGILDLSNTKIKKLPDSLSGLVNLRALILLQCLELECVPYLGNLKKLKELDLGSTAIEEFPQGIKELSNLRFLSFDSCSKLKMFPEHLLKTFPYLQCLFLPDHIEAPVEEIEKLKHLEELCGRVKDASEFNRLISSSQDLAYNIVVGSEGFSYYDFNNERMGYNQLVFSKYDFKDMAVLAKGIQHLLLRSCVGLSNCFIEFLRQLSIDPTSIKTLYISNCEGIECLWRIKKFRDRGGVTTISTSRPSPPPLPAFFSSLSVLWIHSCGNMKKLGLPASQLHNLTQLNILNCEMMEEILEVSEDIEGEASMVSLPKLEILILIELPRLKSICNAKLVCSSIQNIRLKGCQALKKLPLVSGIPNYDSPPPQLRYIEINNNEKEWWEKMELGHTTHHSLLQPFLHYVEP